MRSDIMTDSPTPAPEIAVLRSSLDPKNFPRWAQACPKAFAAMQASILDAAVKMRALNLSKNNRDALAQIMGSIAAVSFAAGRASVKEGFDNGLDEPS